MDFFEFIKYLWSLIVDVLHLDFGFVNLYTMFGISCLIVCATSIFMVGVGALRSSLSEMGRPKFKKRG